MLPWSALIVGPLCAEALAADLYVRPVADSPGEYTSLNEAVQDAADGDTIYIDDDWSPENEGLVEVIASVTIAGEGTERGRVPSLVAAIGETLTLRQLRLVGSESPGAYPAAVPCTEPLLADEAEWGLPLCVPVGGTVYGDDLEIAPDGAIGIVVAGGVFEAAGVVAVGWSSAWAALTTFDARSSVTLTEPVFEGCDGGAISAQGGSLTLIDPVFTGNTDPGGNGADVHAYGSTLEVSGGVFAGTGTDTPWSGGSVYLNATDATFTGTTFAGYAATYGGVLFTEAGTVDLEDVVVSGSRADAWGGGVFVKSGHLTLRGGLWSALTAGNGGGAVYAMDAGALTIEGGTQFVTCRAEGVGDGGAIFVDETPLDVRDARFCGNSAQQGGAVFVVGTGGGESAIARSVFIGNTGEGASIYDADTGTIGDGLRVEHNDFLADEVANSGPSVRLQGAGRVFAHNIVGDVPLGLAWGGDRPEVAWNLWWEVDTPHADGDDPGGVVGDPAFVAYDGSCGSDVHLTAGSAAIDAGDPADVSNPDDTPPDVGVYWYEATPADSGDTAVPTETGEPEDSDPTYSGGDARVHWIAGGGGCGCDGAGGGTGAAALVWLLLARWRRLPGERFGGSMGAGSGRSEG